MQAEKATRPLGRVVGLWRYPVKSMAGQPLREADVSWHGFAGDRRWAFVRDDARPTGFPWLTLRERHDMGHYRASFVDPARPDTSPTQVTTPDGDEFDITDPAFASRHFPQARLIRQGRGVFDTFPLSLITTQTIDRLGDSVGAQLEVERFRPNILVDADETAPYPEDSWVGRVLTIGGMQMRIDKRDGRCVVITIDPASGERDPAILRAVNQDRQGCLGVYGTTVTPGRISVGDSVYG
jgi:uncharacterized protein YcbX